jgi:hypothetical protein
MTSGQFAGWKIVLTKRSTLPPQRKFLPSGGGGEKKLFLIIVNVLGHPKGVRGLTSNFLRGGGMDVFWNDPISSVGVVWMFSGMIQLLCVGHVRCITSNTAIYLLVFGAHVRRTKKSHSKQAFQAVLSLSIHNCLVIIATYPGTHHLRLWHNQKHSPFTVVGSNFVFWGGAD